jgi:hypothetical protein
VSRVPRHLLERRGHDLLHLLVADGARCTATGLVEKSRRAALDVAGAPLTDGLVGEVECLGDLGVGKAVRAAQDNAGALSQAVTGLWSFGPPDQLRTVIEGLSSWVG